MGHTIGRPTIPRSCSGHLFRCALSYLSSRAGIRASSILYSPTYRLTWSRNNIWRCLKASTSGGKYRSSYVLKLLKNIGGGRASGLIWVEHLRKGLEEMGFEQCASDPCSVFFRGKLIFLHFVDDCICLSPNPADVDRLIAHRKPPCSQLQCH